MNIDPEIAAAVASGVWIPAIVLAILFKCVMRFNGWRSRRRHNEALGLNKNTRRKK